MDQLTLRSLLDEQFILSEQGSIFLENQLSEQAEFSAQGGIILEQYGEIMPFYLRNINKSKRKQQFWPK